MQNLQKDYARCPIIPQHTMRKQKLKTHVQKCRKTNKFNTILVQCKYDMMHWIQHDDLRQHQLNCPSRVDQQALLLNLEADISIIQPKIQPKKKKQILKHDNKWQEPDFGQWYKKRSQNPNMYKQHHNNNSSLIQSQSSSFIEYQLD